DGSFRYSGYCSRFFRPLQHKGGDRHVGLQHRKGEGDSELMSELRDLYQEVILEHAKSPRNYRVLASPDYKAEGFNPLCGDRCTVYLSMNGDVIQDIAFQGSGCAISRASASMMTQSL